MELSMDIQYFMQKIAEELHLNDTPKQDKNGYFQLKIQRNTILIKDLHPGLFFSAKIVALPQERNNEALYLYLMQANILGRGTGGSALGIDTMEKYFTLSHILPFELDYVFFYETLEDFVNYLDYWKQKIPTLSM